MKIRSTAALVAALALPLVPSCSSGGGSDSFTIRNTRYGVAPSTVVAIRGQNLAFLADEATTNVVGMPGTSSQLNPNDTDTVDSVAIFVDTAAKTQTNLAVAALDLAWIGNELYLVVEETRDNFDWSGADGISGFVLLHWSKASGALAYVDDLVNDPDQKKIVAVGDYLFYASADVPSGALASSLRSVNTSLPLAPVDVATTDAGGALSPQIVRSEEGLVLLVLDENDEGRDLNGDTDATDAAVLALLDATEAGDPIHVVGRALASAAAPMRAKKIASHDWQVGFLVNEAAQGGTNLNDPTAIEFSPSWYPSQCGSAFSNGDDDTFDDVVQYLRFSAWTSNPVTSPVRNTGLVGVDKIAIANNFIATITPESAAAGVGEGNCDLNDDGDKADRVVRWARIETGTNPILPLNTAANILALFDAPGGTHGLSELDARFVIVVSEADENQDFNGDTLETFNLVAWLTPSTSVAAWDFTHGSQQTFAGASFVAEQPDRTRLNVAYEEKVFGDSLNDGTPQNPGDDDELDSVPTFADFSGSLLTFPGAGVALDLARPGIISAKGFGFYRIDELADDRDWNGDGSPDKVLFRSSFQEGRTFYFATLNSLDGPAIYVNGDETAPRTAAFLTIEVADGPSGGTDLNQDGDKNDLVLRWFSF